MSPRAENQCVTYDSSDLEVLRHKCLKSEFKMTPRLDDELLRRCLRVRNNDIEKALKSVQNFWACAHQNRDFLQGVEPSKFTAGFSSQAVNFLNRRSNGRRVGIVRFSNWNPKTIPLKEFQVTALYVGEYVSRETQTQDAGIEIVIDASGITLSHLYNLSFKEMKRMMGVLQKGLPIKVSGLHIVNAHYLAIPLIKLFTALLSQKLKSRLSIHCSLQDFHKFIHPEILPVQFGGTLDDVTAYDAKLMETIVKDNIPSEVAECWLTLAECDLEGWAALTLARSIRKTLTRRSLTIVVSQMVSRPMCTLLKQEFDSVVTHDISNVGSKIGIISLWNLRGWNKCVFVNPKSYMLKNSDDLFSSSEFSAALTPTQPSTFSSDLFLFKPNQTDFGKLLEQYDGNGHLNFDSYFTIERCNTKHHISLTYIEWIESLDCASNDSLHAFNIICYKKYPQYLSKKPNEGVTGLGEFFDKWMTTFVKEVISQVSGVENDSEKEFLLNSLEEHNLPTEVVIKNTINEDMDKYKNAIAVLGMSCRFPGANSNEEFWELLCSGTDPIRKYPEDRPRRLKGMSESELNFQAGFLKCPIDEFDAKFFEMSPREAPFVDPQQRILLEVIWESLENSNINPQSLRESNTGVFMGIWQHDYERDIKKTDLIASEFHHTYLGNAFSASASRISHLLGLYGPNLAIESGCSSSSSAVHLAVQCLRRGEASLAIASGVNVILRYLSPFGGDDEFSVLSNDYRCKTFDESAKGFVRAEGCGAVVLKTLTNAVRDGDDIIALIRGTALNNDGPATSFGTPNATAQMRVFRDALADARVKPWEVSLVEAHGTGTIVGDPIETYAIGQVYSEGRSKPLLLGSVKSNIGHTESCAGMAGLIKVLLCIKHKKVPPQLHFQKLNSRISLETIPANIPLEVTDWQDDNRIAAVSSFSMSGTNVHLIVQEPLPKFTNQKTDACDNGILQAICISAKSEEALEALCEKYILYLEKNPNVSLSAFAYTVNTARANMTKRIALVAKDSSELLSNLQKRSYISAKAPVNNEKVVFLFPGQGSQYFGMAKKIYEVSTVFQKHFNRCDQLFIQYLDCSLHTIVWIDNKLLDQTLFCQPAIFSIQFCLLKLWNSFGIQPSFVLGHSVGEYCAAVAAGVLSLEDAMRLIIERSKLVHVLETGSMLAVNTSSSRTQVLIEEFVQNNKGVWIDIAAANSINETVVSGVKKNVEMFAGFCNMRGLKTQMLSASHAFHSRQVDSVLREFSHYTSKLLPGNLTCRYISGTLGREIKAGEFTGEYWIKHLRDTVRFQEATNLAWNLEGRIYIEIGSQPVLLSLMLSNIENSSNGIFCPTLRKTEDDLTSIMNSVAKLFVSGLDICWKKWGFPVNKLILPTYPFQRQKFWYKNFKDEFKQTSNPHPLLGCRYNSPVSDTVFTQVWSAKDLSYVEDHIVANRIILPAAAYLETIMAAGCNVLQDGQLHVPFSIDNFNVEAALELSKPCQTQTIVRSIMNGDVEFDVGIFTSRGGSCKWKKHASATFGPSVRPTEASRFCIEEKVHERISPELIDKVYEKAEKTGVKFGQKFRSIFKLWRGNQEIFAQIYLPPNSTSYICHPIILDAMIQTLAIRNYFTIANFNEISLQLPIAIKKFTWFCIKNYTNLYTHITMDSSSTVRLLNEIGETLGIIEGLELVSTTPTDFLTRLNSDLQKMPHFMEETWRPTSGITFGRLNTDDFKILPGKFMDATRASQALQASVTVEVMDITDALGLCIIQRGILESRWPWKVVGERLALEEWSLVAPKKLFIAQRGALMDILAKHGYLEECGDGIWKIKREIPLLEQLESKISKGYEQLASLVGEKSVAYRLIKQVGSNFSNILQGKMLPISVLFPKGSQEIGLVELYVDDVYSRQVSEVSTSLLLDCVSHAEKGVLRILEVGAGSGVCCDMILKGLKNTNIAYNYTFTDISLVFLSEAERKFPKGVTFALFNIEEEPLKQGFIPGQFDVIIATNVVHATSNISVVLKNLNTILRLNGILVLGELFKDKLFFTLSFGLLDGWWNFSDRKYSPLLNQYQWVSALKNAGFSEASAFPIVEDTCGVVVGRKAVFAANVYSARWLSIPDESLVFEELIKKMSNSGRIVDAWNPNKPIPLNLEGVFLFWTTLKSNQLKCKEHLHLCQNLITAYQNEKFRPRLILVTRGVTYIGDQGPGNPEPATSASLFRTFANEHPEFSVMHIDLDQDNVDTNKEAEELFASFWMTTKEMFKAIRGENIFFQRLTLEDRPLRPLSFPNSTRFKIATPPSKSLSDLRISATAKIDPVGYQVEVTVLAAALNFRDIFMILQPEGFIIPENLNKDPGFDVSGVVSAVGPESTKFKIGDAVYGSVDGGGLASHVIADSRFLMRKPDGMSYASAATMPVCYLTVLYSFQECAGLTSGDCVLIHVATGGVGLAAIEVAKRIGATIFATAGSRRKRAYLKSIGIQNVYHSRNTAFGDQILNDTHGTGVNVVLNSSMGPNFKETSLKVCARGARFVEIGKLNIWTVEEIKALRPDVKYFMVDLTEPTARESVMKLTDEMEMDYQKRSFKSLPHKVFSIDMVKEAFFYFQEAKQIGKIVLRMPEARTTMEGKILFQQNMFYADATYIITGGLGGIGLELAKWMCSSGARHLVLIGRNSPNDNAVQIINSLNVDGCFVVALQANVGIYEQCENILGTITSLKFPPLRGIMHAAGVISDAILTNQTWEKFEAVFEPKVQGTINLHKLTLYCELEFFVLFSSIAALAGSKGQSNHAAANRFQDSFAHYRWSLGLPATTINFGPWADVGAASRFKYGSDALVGIRAFTPKQGIMAIEKILQEHRLQVGVGDIVDMSIFKQALRLGHFLDEMKSDVALSKPKVDYKSFIEEIRKAKPDERQSRVEEFLQTAFKETLRISETEVLDADQKISEIGVDSLMAMELRSRIQATLGDKHLTVSALQEHRTIRSLAAHIIVLLDTEDKVELDTVDREPQLAIYQDGEEK